MNQKEYDQWIATAKKMLPKNKDVDSLAVVGKAGSVEAIMKSVVNRMNGAQLEQLVGAGKPTTKFKEFYRESLWKFVNETFLPIGEVRTLSMTVYHRVEAIMSTFAYIFDGRLFDHASALKKIAWDFNSRYAQHEPMMRQRIVH